MKCFRLSLLFLCFAGLSPLIGVVQAANEDSFLEQSLSSSEQIMGRGQSALWTLPLVATQYQPLQPTPVMNAALQAQQDGRFLEALILLDEASKDEPADTDTKAEINLLHTSFLLQGNQTQQALEITTALLSKPQYAADTHALTAMARLQQGRMQEALAEAQQARDLEGGVLPYLVNSYALQGAGRLAEARDVMHEFNARTPQLAVALAREVELDLTLDQIQSAKTLMLQAQQVDAANPYVIAVSGLVYLIDGQAEQAKAAFEIALQRDPKDAKALFGLGLAEIKLGNFQVGQKKLQSANEADPGSALILTYLGRSQQRLGQTEAARASWRSAQQADPKDPAPWLYQAQAELQANQPLAARESLHQAQARSANRAVYRGANLLREDEQLLQANLAETQRRLGLDTLAFHTLADGVSEKNAVNLRNQAEVLEGQRFAESARRSLLLQSQFNDRPGNLPVALDIYGDGVGQTGAATPQHSVVSGLNAQRASYNDYDELFTQHTMREVDATVGSKNTSGAQIRLGVGNNTLGLGLAGLQFKTDGYAPFENLDNSVWQGIAQWQPTKSTQAFVSYQTFNSLHGETRCPADPLNCAVYQQLEDNSSVTRLGLRHSLTDHSELRGLISRQQTSQTDNWEWVSNFLPPPNNTIPEQGVTYGTKHNSSAASSVELQYRRNGTSYAMQSGVSWVRSPLIVPSLWGTSALTNIAQQIYLDWQRTLNPRWQLETGLAWGKNDKLLSLGIGNSSTSLYYWLPKLGMVYTPDSATHVRVAAWQGLDSAAVGNASLAPASLAGIVLNRHGDIYKLVQSVALGADRQLNAAWLLEGQTQQRWTDEPFITSGVQNMNRNHVHESRLALHWQPGSHPLKVTLAYDDERLQNDPANRSPDSVQEQHLRSQQLNSRWFASPQWTVNLLWSHNLLDAMQQSLDNNFDPILLDVRQHFNQADASLSWQFNQSGALDVGVRNATGKSFQYTETDPLIPRFSKGRLWYAKFKLAW